MYLFNIGPEVVNPTSDGAGNVPQPHLFLSLHAFLHLLLFVMVTCTCAHKLQTEMSLNSKSKQNFSLLYNELSLALLHVAECTEVSPMLEVREQSARLILSETFLLSEIFSPSWQQPSSSAFPGQSQQPSTASPPAGSPTGIWACRPPAAWVNG